VEVLKSVNARIINSLELLDEGRIDEAKVILKRLSLLLPDPEERHKEAAKG